MAEIVPFRALHYDPVKVEGLENVITQPYDKISPEMQERYYGLSSYNLARIIRRRQEPGERAGDIYTGAAAEFNNWINKGVLRATGEPALFPYSQEYTVPGEAADASGRRTRHGFIALVRLEDYAAGVIHRHEETLSGPKADRLELLKATRAHFGQIFLLYSDPSGEIDAYLARATETQRLWECLEDEYGTLHRVWQVTDAAAVARVTELMRGKKLVIADGHHRYETALAYRDFCRTQGANGGSEYVMATLVRMEQPGLTILPTHRVVHSLPKFDWRQFLAQAQRCFEVEEQHPAPPVAATGGIAKSHIRGQGPGGAILAALNREAEQRLEQRIAEAGRSGPAFGAYAGPGKTAVLKLRKDADLARLLPDVPSGLARLDVVVLHRLLLEGALGIDRQAVREERNLHYVREFAQAIRQVEDGAQICFLLNPTPIEAVRDNAFAGQVLPQKSTDFYPKLLSGLTIYWLDQSGGI
jgi:uncharacterized protein (DUF1015 family)